MRAASARSSQARAAGPGRRPASGPEPWAERVRQAGWEPSVLAASSGSPRSDLHAPELNRVVATRLASRRSDFRREDVLVALASTYPGGVPVGEALAWTERFCAAGIPVASPTVHPRWTSSLAVSSDLKLAAGIRPLAARVGPGPDREQLAELLREAGLTPEAENAIRTIAGGHGVVVLACPPGRSRLLAQAEVVDACRELWVRCGRRVAVDAPTPLAAARWEVLAGLTRQRPGDAPDLLVVDQADRRSSSDLCRLVEQADRRGSALVLVQGGTLPALTNPVSHGLLSVAGEMDRVDCGPHRAWSGQERSLLVGRAAASTALRARDGLGGSALLVGLGLEEVRGMNWAVSASPWAAGDRVVVLRGGADRLVYGQFGTLEKLEVDRATIRWDGEQVPRGHDVGVLRRLGRGWAVTPHLAARTDGPVVALGPAAAFGPLRSRVVASLQVPEPGRERTLW